MSLAFNYTLNSWLGLNKDHVSAEKYLLLSPQRHCDKSYLETSSGVTLPCWNTVLNCSHWFACNSAQHSLHVPNWLSGPKACDVDLVFAEMSVLLVASDTFKRFAEAKTVGGEILEKRNNRSSLLSYLPKNTVMQCFIHHEEKKNDSSHETGKKKHLQPLNCPLLT